MIVDVSTAASPKTILDTDIFSELMRGKNQHVRTRAQAYLVEHGRLTVTAITVIEIVKGLHKVQRQEALSRFLAELPSLEIASVGPEEAVVAGKIYGDLERLGQPIGRADPIIAGITCVRGFVLATGNEDHYRRIQAAGYTLVLDNWRAPTAP